LVAASHHPSGYGYWAGERPNIAPNKLVPPCRGPSHRVAQSEARAGFSRTGWDSLPRRDTVRESHEPTTDQKVGGSNPSERAKSPGHLLGVALQLSGATGFATFCNGGTRPLMRSEAHFPLDLVRPNVQRQRGGPMFGFGVGMAASSATGHVSGEPRLQEFAALHPAARGYGRMRGGGDIGLGVAGGGESPRSRRPVGAGVRFCR
jgi:hypothetical protein